MIIVFGSLTVNAAELWTAGGELERVPDHSMAGRAHVINDPVANWRHPRETCPVSRGKRMTRDSRQPAP
jgi:hypothetical protein